MTSPLQLEDYNFVYNKLYDIKVKSQNLHFYCAGKKMEYQNSTYGKRNDRA